VYSKDKKKSTEEEILDEIALDSIINEIIKNGEYEISLSIRIQGKLLQIMQIRYCDCMSSHLFSYIGRKPYGDWEIGKVLSELLHQKGSTYGDVPQFNLGICL